MIFSINLVWLGNRVRKGGMLAKFLTASGSGQLFPRGSAWRRRLAGKSYTSHLGARKSERFTPTLFPSAMSSDALRSLNLMPNPAMQGALRIKPRSALDLERHAAKPGEERSK